MSGLSHLTEDHEGSNWSYESTLKLSRAKRLAADGVKLMLIFGVPPTSLASL
jgi:hypothetical protein